MARASGRLVMTGNREGEFRMSVEFSEQFMMPHSLRSGGYYLGKRTSVEMIEELSRRASTTGMDDEKPDITGSVGNVGTVMSVDALPTVESQSSTESPKPATPGPLSPYTGMDTAKADSPKDDSAKEDFPKDDSAKEDVPKDDSAEAGSGGEGFAQEGFGKVGSAKEGSGKEDSGKQSSGKEGFAEEVSERSHSVVGLQPLLGPFTEKPARAMGRAPIGSLRRDLSSDEFETEIKEVDDYYVVGEDGKEHVSLSLLPLELEEGKTIGGSVSTTELSLLGKSNGADIIMRRISAWKLTLLENLSFQIQVKIMHKGDAKWVKLGKPRSGFKKTAADFFSVAKVLALLKKEPQASEDRVWNHLLEGDVAPETFRDHLSMLYPLMEQFVKLDPVLKETDALKTLLSLLDREKEANSGKRVLSDRDSSDEVDNRPVKKFKTGNIVQRYEKATKVGMTSSAMPEDVNMGEPESEEEYYHEDEVYESDEEYGDSFCIFCDDGGVLLCCDGPCMRSFHATKEAGGESKCRSLGLSEAAVARMVGKWLCKNCKYKKHQCYVCGELGDSASDASIGVRQEVFVCNVACCGKYYHPKCIASKFAVSPGERETLAENILAGKESFTCPLHTCKLCGKGEDREEEDLHLVKCRRCPSAWHKKCLPRTISFAEDAAARNLKVRAWKFSEKHKQFICYCTNHKLIDALGTPKRDHVNFGLSPEEANEIEQFENQKKKVGAVTKEPDRYGAQTSVLMGRSADHLIAKARSERVHASSSVPPPRPNVSKDAAKRSDEAAKRIAESIVAASKRKVKEATLKDKLEKSLPGIYKPKSREFMKMGMVDSILEAARAAVEKIRRDRVLEAMTICDRKTVQSAMHEEERLRTYLAPTLFGKRYTSYGRHFTKVQKLQKVVEILQPYIWERDTIVDFSCGDNSFCRLLRKALSAAGKTNCQFKNFDIFPSKDSFGFDQKNWLDVGLKDCGPGENLVIGLNPPFAFVDKFISHALGMNPRILVLIVPPMRINLEHLGFECVVDDELLMAEKSFYLPGSVNEKNSECLEQGNQVAPHFYIYCSKKFFGRYKVGVSEEGPPTANPSTITRKPAKPPPPSEPTANIFIPKPGQTSNQKASRKVAPQIRDPRQQQSLPSRVPRLLEEGEIASSQFKKNKRPIWRHEDQQILAPPPPPFVQHLPPRVMRPPHFEHHHPGPRYPHHRPPEYNPFEPELFPHGGNPHPRLPPPFRPQYNGFYRPPPEQFYPGPSPPRNHGFPPEDDDGSFGGWID